MIHQFMTESPLLSRNSNQLQYDGSQQPITQDQPENYVNIAQESTKTRTRVSRHSISNPISNGILGLIAVNNQSTLLMSAMTQTGDIMFMHETRIFYFKRKKLYQMRDESQKRFSKKKATQISLSFNTLSIDHQESKNQTFTDIQIVDNQTNSELTEFTSSKPYRFNTEESKEYSSDMKRYKVSNNKHTVESWLNSFGLHECYQSFKLYGFESLDLVKEINNQNELIEIDIPISKHRFRIMKEINILKLRAWFIDTVGLEQYFELFVNRTENPINSLELIKRINDKTQLRDIGILQYSHRLKIMNEIIKLRQGQSYDEQVIIKKAKQFITNEIIGVLTTQKYRILYSLYLGFVIFDVTFFVFFIIALFGEKEANSQKIGKYLSENRQVFIVVAAEVFYNIFQTVQKIWLMSRVSLYITISLYISYAIIFHSFEMWDRQIINIFCARVAAFVLKTLTQYCIDLELDYDLSEDPMPKIYDLPILSNNNDEKHIIDLPDGWEYKGSICVWTPLNTVLCDDEITKDKRSTLHHCFLGPFIVLVALILAIIAGIWAILLSVIWKIITTLGYVMCGIKMCKKSHTIFGEFKTKML